MTIAPLDSIGSSNAPRLARRAGQWRRAGAGLLASLLTVTLACRPAGENDEGATATSEPSATSAVSAASKEDQIVPDIEQKFAQFARSG